MRIFVAGATGVIGRRAVPLMTAAGHEVTAVGRTPEKRAALERQGARAVAVDLFDADAVRRAAAGHDAVVNLATRIPSGLRAILPGAWAATARLRREASPKLVDAALAGGAARFIQESFAPVYPDRGDRWIAEDTPVRPARYNRTVLDAEAAAERVTREGGAGVVLRFAFFYGPDDAFTRDLLSFIRRGWMPILGSPDAFLSMVSHDDAASAVVAALDVPAGIYNVVDDEPARRREFADALAAMLGVRPPKLLPAWVAKLGGSLGETLARSLRISNRKLKATGAWTPRHPSMIDGWRAVVQGAGR